MDRRRFVTTTALGTAAGLLGTPRLEAGAGEAGDRPQASPRSGLDVMRREHPARSGIALGGLGTGSAELRKDGCFHNWTCFNNEPQFTGPRLAWPQDSILFFVLRYQLPGREPRLKLLQIESDRHEQASVEMALYEMPWLSGVDRIAYRARFPFAWLDYADDHDAEGDECLMPLQIELEAMSPFVPHDVEASSLPAMILDFRVRSLASEPVDVMLMASLRNVAGYDTADKAHATRLDRRPGAVLCTMTATGLEPDASSLGTTTLASLSDDTSFYLGWEHRHPYYERLLREKRLPDLDDTEGRNPVDRGTGKRRAMERLWSTLGRSATIAPGDTLAHGFVVAWHFPNLWDEHRTHVEGHAYAARFAGSAEVASHVIERKGDLVGRSRAFQDAFYDSTAPGYVLDQVNSQLNTFATSSWLTAAGDFGILEGMAPDQSWGPIATMDVSMYGGVAVAALFPELQKASMRAHRRLQADSGEMSHGIEKDFARPKRGVAGVDRRLDLHAQYAFMVLRDFLWTSDEAYLREMWPSVKGALDYVARERDLDADGLPDMEGIMSSYDNFPMYGAASFIVSQWLAALAAAVLGARAAGDRAAEERYAALLAKGRSRAEARLWNGRYFRLWNDEGGKHGGKDEGCLTDQLVGLWAAHPLGLGPLLAPDEVRTALRSILEMSYRRGFGLRNCSWPGDAPWHDVPADIWVDQANTCWSGVELAFASFLVYEGLVEEGLCVLKTVDDRYRRAGRYFDHQEFGGHYFRPMAAWAMLHALLGLTILDGRYTFAPRLDSDRVRLFFSHGAGTATYSQAREGGRETIAVEVRTGSLTWREMRFLPPRPGHEARLRVRPGAPALRTAVAEDDGALVIRPEEGSAVLAPGGVLEIDYGA
jgi:non-lysosomal glucosylceramidase